MALRSSYYPHFFLREPVMGENFHKVAVEHQFQSQAKVNASRIKMGLSELILLYVKTH